MSAYGTVSPRGGGALAGSSSHREYSQQTPTAPPHVRPLVEALANQRAEVMRLHEMINALTERLYPVLAPVPSSGEAKGNAPDPITLRQTIAEHTAGVTYCAGRLSDILDRLEI